MLKKTNTLFIVLIYWAGTAVCLFETCDQTFNLAAGETRTISSPYYPQYQYQAGSSCRYYITAPSGYEIVMSCQISIPQATSGACDTDIFYIGRDGNKTLTGAEYFCGAGTVARTSLFNYVVMAYASYTTTKSGWFTCTAKAQVQACDCGWSVNTKIVGGTAAQVNEYPSMAGVVYTPSALIFCGGAIIHYRWILTAAHCLSAYNTNLAVLVGDHDYTIGTETFYSSLYTVSSYITHAQYNAATQNNDIALLQTSKDILYSRGVGPACLPFNYVSQLFTNAQVDAAGWGSTSFGGPVSNYLQKIQLFIYSNTDCSAFYTVDANKMCSYAPNKDTCQYDSGGNLFYRTSRMFNVGIVSYGSGCGAAKPSVNTRITSYLSWIQTNTGATFCVKS